MFCQNCGAELRLETGFCSVCGAGAPAPRLHVDPKTTDQPGQRRTPSAQTPPASGTRAAQSSITKSQPTYQPPMPRHTPRHVAPVASLDISLPKPSPSPLLGNAPDAQPTAAPPEAVTAVPPTTPVTISFPAAEAAETPPAPPAPATNGQPSLLAWAYAPVVPPVSPFTQQTLHGYYPAGWMPPAPAQNGAQPAPPPGSYSLRLLRTTTGIHIPRDIPNRIALGALAAALLSFFLPWLIIANQRTTPLSVGWPVALPMLVIIAVGLTILLPERALYLRWFLALPLMLGCFFLGSALLLFLLSSAIAANTAGASFLGVDIGFFLFIVASLALACVGYFKLVRELPLMLSGRLLLAPLPRFLQALSEQPAPTAPQPMPVAPVAPVAQTNIGSNGNAAQAISPPPVEPASTP